MVWPEAADVRAAYARFAELGLRKPGEMR